jgi:hypothetical protein
MGGKISLTGRQASRLYEFLGQASKVSASDKMRLGRLRRRLQRLLETNDEGIHDALSPIMRPLHYTAGDVQQGIPASYVGKPAVRADGTPIEVAEYNTNKLSSVLGELSYDPDEAGTLFRFCRARIEDSASSGAIAEHVLQVAAWFPGIVDVIEKSLCDSYKEDPFQYTPPQVSAE